MQPVVFESLNRGNCSDAYAMHQQCHSNPWSESAFIDCLHQPYFGLQMKSSADVVAYFVGLNVVGEVTLMDIGVNANRRGQGLGREMLNEFVKQSLSLGGEEIWLEVRQSNSHAIKLYESFGFDLMETRKNYYAVSSGKDEQSGAKEDALIMKKLLKSEVF